MEAAAVMAGGSLLGGILNAKANAEMEKRKQLGEINQNLGMQEQAALAQKAQGVQQSYRDEVAGGQNAMSNLMSAYKAALVG